MREMRDFVDQALNLARGPESSKPGDGNNENVKQELGDATSEKPFFAPSERTREAHVQNAVKFLSHPKVRGSPIIYRRSFLEKKGLTKEEIDEAFRQVPDPPSDASIGAAATAPHPNSSTSVTPQASGNISQSALSPVNNNPLVPSMQRLRFHWSHALIALGVFAVSGAGLVVFFKKSFVPRLKTWIRKVVAEENEWEKEDESHLFLAKQTAEAAKAAAAAAAIAAKASKELMNSKNEERKYFDVFMGMMDVQVKEMKSMGEAICKLEGTTKSSNSQEKWIEEYRQSTMGNGTTNNSWGTSQVNQPNSPVSSMVAKEIKLNGTPNPNYGAVTPSSAPATAKPTIAPHPKSYMEIFNMIQRGEKPPNIKDINDMPPNPNQQPSKPLLQPRPKPWEVSRPNQPSNGEPAFDSDNGISSLEPSWRKKAVKISEIEPDTAERSSQLQQQSGEPGEGASRAFAAGLGDELEMTSE